MSWEENYKKACKDNERISPWFWVLAIMFLAALIIPFISLGVNSGKDMVEVLKTNRTYISQHTYDEFVKNNP